MQQDADGLWFHGNFIAEGKTSPYKWGRGNGWAMVATVEVLSAMPENHPSRRTLLDILKRHIHGVLPLQAPSGLWRQVLDHSELWEETSCSAMFAYSIARAVRRGWIGAETLPFARKAFDGISANVTENGLVNGTCEGTGIGTTLNFYVTRRRPVNDSHGIGPVLLAGSELMLADSIGVPPSGAVLGELGNNFPNPFASHTRFFYFIRDPGPVQISVYDLRGRRIKTLLDRALGSGTGFMEWDATDDGQRSVPSGTYLIRMEQGSATRLTKKAVFIGR